MYSWYTSPPIDSRTVKYCHTIESIFRLKNANRKWVDFKLTPHQIEWHSKDVALLGSDATSRVVVKSRNTSFTTNSLVSNLMAVGRYQNQIVPFVRLNSERAVDLIQECKEIINNMKKTIHLGNDEYYPFNPELVDMKAKSRIIFPDKNVEFRAFAANSAASENIRGLRVIGSAGIIDEANQLKNFNDIYIALRDANAGVDESGLKQFQMNIGTTLKGLHTPFKIWYDNQMKLDSSTIQVFKWPVFDPNKFNVDISPMEQDLMPIVPWQTIKDLSDLWYDDKDKFLEEYMAIVSDSDDAFYKQDVIMNTINPDLKNLTLPNDPDGEYYGGVDPAGEGNDYFAVAIYEKCGDKMVERLLYYDRNTPLEDMMQYCDNLINVWNLAKMRIDANGLGYQLGQSLKNKYPHVVELIRGNVRVKIGGGQGISINEFLHTNQLGLMRRNKMELLPDDLQSTHFNSWSKDYKCDRTKEYGHGDTTIASGLAVLSRNWRMGDRAYTVSESAKEVSDDVLLNQAKEQVKSFSQRSLKDRMAFYKRAKKY